MAFVKSPDNISIELLQEGEKLKPQEPWLSMGPMIREYLEMKEEGKLYILNIVMIKL